MEEQSNSPEAESATYSAPVPPTPSHTSRKGLIVVVVIIIVAIGIAYYLMNKSDQGVTIDQTTGTVSQPNDTASASKTAEFNGDQSTWKLYTSTKHGVKAKYPSEWSVIADVDSYDNLKDAQLAIKNTIDIVSTSELHDPTFNFVMGQNDAGIRIFLSTLTNQQLADSKTYTNSTEYFNKAYSNIVPTDHAVADITIDGLIGKKMSSTDASSPEASIYYINPAKNIAAKIDYVMKTASQEPNLDAIMKTVTFSTLP